MPRATTAPRLAYAALAASDAALAGSAAPRAHRVRRITKPLLVPVLAASMATDPRTHDSPLRTTTRAGQALGWLGDIALLGRGSGAFVAGMAAFGAGQAAYIRGFRTVRDPEPLSRSVIGRSAALLFAVSGPPMAYGAARHDPVLGPGVLAYAGLLTAMAAHAAHLDPALPAGARRASASAAPPSLPPTPSSARANLSSPRRPRGSSRWSWRLMPRPSISWPKVPFARRPLSAFGGRRRGVQRAE